jgi:ATP-binding cassette, subfamily B (MDR/TAP), member 1
MMVSRGLFGWSPPHVQPLTPVSEVSEPPESPSPFMDIGGETSASQQMEAEEEMEEMEDIEPPPAAVPFSRLFACADRFDWFLMVVGSIAAAAHGTALVVYLHYFAKVIRVPQEQDMFHRFKEVRFRFIFFFIEIRNQCSSF